MSAKTLQIPTADGQADAFAVFPGCATPTPTSVSSLPSPRSAPDRSP
jgi:hypothetical protein